LLLLFSLLHICLFCRKVDYFSAKGFVKDPHTVVATLASGQQVTFTNSFFMKTNKFFDVLASESHLKGNSSPKFQQWIRKAEICG